MWIDDRIIARASETLACVNWVPESTFVVCGRSNNPEIECQTEQCAKDGIAILKRYGGGGTVVLHPGCAIVSLGCWVDDYYRNDHFFRAINQAVINSLAAITPAFQELGQDGLSDIVYGRRKIAGTSLFRSRNYLLYQGSIMVSGAADLFARYLRHPSKEPDYRAGRSHEEFVTDLATIHSGLSVAAVIESLNQYFARQLQTLMGQHLIPAQDKQIPHLLKKIES